jgi:hypothetical protein
VAGYPAKEKKSMSYDLKQPVYVIGPETSNEELVKIANNISYLAGIRMNQFALTVLESARRIAILEEQLKEASRDAANWRAAQPRLAEIEKRLAKLEAGAPPHLSAVERRSA